MICVPAPAFQEMGGGGGTRAPQRLALLITKQWPVSVHELHVRFVEGEPALWARVAELMTGPLGWNSASALQFRFDQAEDAPIRVSFAQGVSWSQLGIEAAAYDGDWATMNLSIRMEDGDDHIRRPILHEFGHAMGFPHEQASPNADLPWNLPAVYAYYREKMGWSDSMIEAQVLRREEEDVAAGTYDPDSIMHYWFPAEFMLDGVARGGRSFLSDGDREMAAAWYGAPPVGRNRAILPFAARS